MLAVIIMAASGCAFPAPPAVVDPTRVQMGATATPGTPDASASPTSVPEATAAPSPSTTVSNPDLPATLASGFRVHAYPIVPLPLADRAYADTGDAPLKIDYPATSDGVPVYVRNDRTYLHPVAAAQQALRQLSTYVMTDRAAYLDRARTIADALIAAGIEADGGLWIPYEFDFNLHGLKSDVMRAPWYSAMAQGQVLSLVSRLYALTGERRYLDDANSVFQSFVVLGKRAGPWVTWVEDRYLWLEEYPGSPPDHTLNGFIFALYGVYDYFEISQSASAERIFQAGLTTIDHYLPDFRNPGGISNYCLLHRALSEKYHHIHVAQLRELTKMTGDGRFAAMADLFEADYP
jgi:hypothetical protein